MSKPININRLFVLSFTLAGLISWNTLPVHSLRQAVGAATMRTDGPAPTTVANGKIAFASDRDGNAEIYTMNPDGSDLIRLTFDPRDDSNPAWSPDGSKIAFVRFNGRWPNAGGEIYAMNADGSNQTRLTTSRDDNFPAWSPDGTKIAFSQDFYSEGVPAVYVMNADGADQKVINFGYQPAWSPDGSKLALTDGFRIWSINADGRGLTQITAPPFSGIYADWDFAPAWSPDGAKIAFSRFLSCNGLDDTCPSSEIWVANADGSSGRPLKGFSNYLTYVDDPAPSWSPDGATIVFSTIGDLFVITADGSGITNITQTNSTTESHPSWPLLSIGCANSVSQSGQSFEANGGTGSVDVSAGSECGWTVSSNASWISVTLGSGSGSGSVSYSVAANASTGSRTAGLIVAGHIVIVTQSGVPVRIISASVEGNKLFVVGENFDPGAVILRNGVERKTKNDPRNPQTGLIGKKAGKKLLAGDTLQIWNPNGTVSQEFTFTGSITPMTQ